MQVRYDNKSLEQLCTDEKEMKKKRADIAGKLPLRIKALEAAPNMEALAASDPLGQWHALIADRAGTWAGKVRPNYRIIIRPEDDGPLATCATVTVLKIDDYH